MAKTNARIESPFVFDRNSVKISKEVIGKGHFSYVFKATIQRLDGSVLEVAAKKVSRNAENEIQILTRLHHKNIITFYGTLPALEDLDTYIFMEFAHKGDLFHYLHERDCTEPIPKPLKWRWIVESAWAIQYLHKENLVHKDIKSPNFLIMSDNTLKLGDFGFTKESHVSQPTHGGGTVRWMAPELVTKQMRSKKSDVYSYGVVVWELQTGEIPFNDKGDGLELIVCLYEGERLSIPDDCEPKIKYILERCLEAEYKKRPSMDGVLDIIENFDPDKDIWRSAGSSAARQPEADTSMLSKQLHEMNLHKSNSGSEEKSLSDCSHVTDPVSSPNGLTPASTIPTIYRPVAEAGSMVHPGGQKKPRSENTRKPLQDIQPQQKENTILEWETEPWCMCRRCKPETQEIEKKCCNNADQCLSLDRKIDDLLKQAHRHTPYREDTDVNKYYSQLRRNTYRLFVAWHFGKLGCGNRVVIPSCCKWKIRQYYPDSKNKYRGHVSCTPRERP